MLEPISRDRPEWQQPVRTAQVLAVVGGSVGGRARESSTTSTHRKAGRSLKVWLIVTTIWAVTLVITVGAVEGLLLLLK